MISDFLCCWGVERSGTVRQVPGSVEDSTISRVTGSRPTLDCRRRPAWPNGACRRTVRPVRASWRASTVHVHAARGGGGQRGFDGLYGCKFPERGLEHLTDRGERHGVQDCDPHRGGGSLANMVARKDAQLLVIGPLPRAQRDESCGQFAGICGPAGRPQPPVPPPDVRLARPQLGRGQYCGHREL